MVYIFMLAVSLFVFMYTYDEFRKRGIDTLVCVIASFVCAGVFYSGAMALVFKATNEQNQPTKETCTNIVTSVTPPVPELDSNVAEAKDPDRFQVKRYNNLKIGGSITNFESYEILDTYTNSHYILIRHDNNISICKR